MCLQATTITARLDAFLPDPYSVFGRSVWDPGTNSRHTSDRMDGGRFRWTVLSGTFGYLGPGDQFFSFCAEPREFVTVGNTYTYTVAPLSAAATNIGGIGVAKANRLRELYGRWLPDMSAPLTRAQAGALQIATWEIAREDTGTLDVYGGDIYFWPGPSENPAGVVALGQTYVTAVDGTGPRLNNLYALVGVGVQDMVIIQDTPEPGTLGLVGAALILAGTIRRKAAMR